MADTHKNSLINFRFDDPEEKMDFTGERFVSGYSGQTQNAHHHRYILPAALCVDKVILDVASGEGYGSNFLSKFASSVTGLDIDSGSIDFARRTYTTPGLSFVCASALSMPFESNSFDVVVSFETIEHVDDHDIFINEVQRVMKPDGLLIISSPNRPIYSEKPNYNNPFHVKELDLDEFQDLLSERFSNTKMYAQRQVAGSLITPNNSQGGINIYSTEDGVSYISESATEAPQYYVGLASNAPIDLSPIGSLLTNDKLIPDLEKQIRDEKTRSSKLESNVRQAQKIAAVVERIDELQTKVDKGILGVFDEIENLETHTASIERRLRESQRSDISGAVREIKAHQASSISAAEKKINAAHEKDISRALSDLKESQLSAFDRLGEALRAFLGKRSKIAKYRWRAAAFFRYPTSSEKRKIWRKRVPLDAWLIEKAQERVWKTERFLWRREAFFRYPTSSQRRKAWRKKFPLAQRLSQEVVNECDSNNVGGIPPESNDISALNARLFERWVDNALGQYSEKDFVDFKNSPPRAEHSDVKLIAYYLPQYHPIPENDMWWGKGFTEWRNVARAFPNFEGHYQPRIPGELGYYDLRVPEVMRRQVELANQYGISAFCFYFYWFAGKTLLETPIRNFLSDKSLNIPFSLCWANENWSRRWDGSENEILISQNYSKEDDEAFLRYVSEYFEDPRYLKIDDRPVLTVYRPSLLPNPSATIKRWRRIARELGYPDLYLISTNSFGFKDYSEFGFDALSEFPPHSLLAENVQGRVKTTNLRTGWRIRQYEDVVKTEKSRRHQGGCVHPGLTMGWDNSARKPAWGEIIHGATPELFREWLRHSFLRAKKNPPSTQLVFINAWNEWAEGTYLEPDKRFGYAFLDVCAEVVREDIYGALKASEIITGKQVRSPENKTILLCSHSSGHALFGGERSMLDVLQAISRNGYNVVVTVNSAVNADYIERLLLFAIEVRVFPYNQWSDDMQSSLAAVPDFLAAVHETRADLVYVNTIVLKSPLEAARLAGVPAIIHARELILADTAMQKDLGLAGKAIVDVVTRSCAHVIANSSATAASFTSRTPMSTIPNVVEVEDLEMENVVQDDVIRFGIISSNFPKKGIDDVVKLARLCEDDIPNARFLIIGPRLNPATQKYVDGSEMVPANVEFVDYLPSPKEAMSRVNVVLNFSHFQESFGRTVLEAMAAGRPVIVYDWGALPELVEHEISGFVVPYKDVDAAKVVVHQLMDITRLQKMGQAAQQRARKIGDRTSFNQAIGKALEKTLDANPSQPVSYTGICEERLAARSEAMIDIVVCVHNAIDDVKACLASIDLHRRPSHQVIIVDDGSDAETGAYLRSYAEDRSYVRLQRNDTATGYTKAVNLGVSLTEADTIILLNSDTIVTKNWAEKLADALYHEYGTGIAGPMSNAASFQSLPSVASTQQQTAVNSLPDGWSAEDMNAFCEHHSTMPLPNVPLVHGFCFAMTREVWDAIGPFDEEAFPQGYGEENDFCLRATDAGFGMVLATNTYVYHAKTKSYSEQARHELVLKSQEILYERHGKARFANAVKFLDRQPCLVKMRAEASKLW